MNFKYIWYGHGTHGLKIGDNRVVVDPFFTDNPSASTSADQVDVDFIVVSHGHGDHTGDLLDIAKRTGALVISNHEIVNWLAKQGLEKLHGQHIGGGFNHPFGYLKLTHALHGSGLPDGSYGGSSAGILLTIDSGKKIYLACDTGLFASMKLIGEEGIDLPETVAESAGNPDAELHLQALLDLPLTVGQYRVTKTLLDGLLHQFATQPGVLGNIRDPVVLQHRLEVEAGAADHDRDLPGRLQFLEDRIKILLEVPQ